MWFWLCFVLCVSTTIAEDCAKHLTNKFYDELQCKPNFENNSKCPTSFDCSGHESRDANSCRYRGKSYAIDSEIPQEESDKCVVRCRCLNSTEGRPYLNCANVECPELFFGPVKDTNCKRLYDDESCCSTETYCKNSSHPEKLTCSYNNITYLEGEKFYPTEEPCKVCYCKEGFEGKFEEPFCFEVKCNVELHAGRNVNDNCVPVYYGQDGCCPIDWRCPLKSGDKVLQPLEKTNSATTAKCKFGALELNPNDVLQTDETDLECKCLLPPYVTCVKKAHHS